MITEWLVTRRCGTKFFRWIAKVWRHCEVHPNANISSNLRLGHGGFGIVIGNCQIGRDVTIMQGTTIGNKGLLQGGFPTISNGVFIGSNCDIIGDITLGDYCTIGAGSVITKTIPRDSIAYNQKDTVVKYKEDYK